MQYAGPIPGLLERERELDLLTSAVSRASDASGGVVLIEGPAGVGKSSLLGGARRLASEAGMQVLEARGAPLERPFAFGVTRQLFEEVALDATEAEREVLFAGAAGLAARLLTGAAPVVASHDADAEFGALHGLYWLTVNLADRAPLLLAVDDAHWADQSSLRFLAYLARRLEGLPVLLVAAARSPDPEISDAWRDLADDPSAEMLRPHALGEDAAAALVRDGLGADAADAFCLACHRATGGNPLFLRELVVALADADVAPTSDAATAVTDVGPPAVSRFVLRRLERLGPAAGALARAVAVLGGDADLDLAASAAGLTADEARSTADLLVRADVLVHDQRLGFVHPIVRTAVYDDILPGERAERHLAAARLLDGRGAPVERVAGHLLHSAPGGERRWVEVLSAAARSAQQRGAPAAAVAYLERALDEPPPDELRAELLCELGRWELVVRDPESGVAHLRAALALDADPGVHARAAAWLGRAATGWGRPEQAVTALEAIDGMAATAGEELALELEAEAVTLTRLALPLRHLVGERLARFERRAADDERFEPVAQIHAACERMIRGEPAAEVADAIEAALAAGPPADPYAFGMAIDALLTTERHDAAARWLDVAVDAARTFGLGPQLASLHAQRALLALAAGAVGEAALDVDTAFELAGERLVVLPRIVGVAIDVALERGELDDAAALSDRHGDLARERLFADEYLIARGRLRIARGDVREGLDDLLHCGELLERHGSGRPTRWRADAARALATLGDREGAERLAREAVALARRFGAPRGLAHSLRAAGAVVGGDEGLALLEEAVAVVEPSPARLEAAYALGDLGAELVARRRRREGRDALRLALEMALKCDATALAARVRGELGAGGGRPPRLELKGVDALTPAERRVCDLAARDLTNRQIAQTLFVTEKTVELHLTNAYRKLGIRSRFQLASVIDPPD